MKKKYKVPEGTRIGHVHLRVSDLDRAINFYGELLGFELQARFGDEAAFLSAGGYHHHIGLNTWHSKGAPRAAKSGVGLYHTAIAYPGRKELALALKRLLEADYPVLGASNHGISEAVYLEDPDGNGVEIYCDRKEEEWPRKNDGSLDLSISRRLDLDKLLSEAE